MKQRIITAIAALAVFLPLLIYGKLPFTLLIFLLTAIATFELLRMKGIKILSFPGILGLVLSWIILIPSQNAGFLEDMNLSKMEAVIFAILLLLTYTVVTKNKFTFDDTGFTILSVLYIAIGFYYFIETRENGLVYIFLIQLIIWATDTGAYFIGRALGKNKLWPEISPNKTVEGFVGGILSAVAVALIFRALADLDESYWMIVISTVLLSIFGQMGDLVESALKRHYNVKDSGQILPGHGGILDRFDSMIFVLPIFHYLMFF